MSHSPLHNIKTAEGYIYSIQTGMPFKEAHFVCVQCSNPETIHKWLYAKEYPLHITKS